MPCTNDSPTPHKGTAFTSPKPLITLTRNLTIRPLLHSDAPRTAVLCNNIKVARNQGPSWPMPYNLDCAHDWIAFARDPKNWRKVNDLGERPENAGVKAPCHWAVAMNGELMGGVGLTYRDADNGRSALVGYWIDEPYWGQGIMTEVCKAWIAWVWKAYPELERLEAVVYSWNPNSTKVLKKIGFEEEGRSRAAVFKFGKRCDLLRFGMVREGIKIDDEAPETLGTQ